MGEHLLDVKNLQTSFASEGGVVTAVRGIDLYLDEGEFLGLVGESGCGKSVSMLSIMRLLDTTAVTRADRIRFGDEDLLSKDAKAMRAMQGKDIGMIFQDPMTCLNPVYTIGNQLMEPLRIHKKLTRQQARERAAQMLETVGISSPEQRLKQYPHEFSGGMRQRAMIAMAMSCNPRLLIADEPTTALDVTIQAQILELMRELRDTFSTATILITHDLGVIASTCSRVMVMYGGLIMESGTVMEIFQAPAHPYTMGLLQSVPGARVGKQGKLVPIPGSPPDLMNAPEGCPFAARCRYAMRICKRVRPQLAQVAPGHEAACWLQHAKAAAMKEEVR